MELTLLQTAAAQLPVEASRAGVQCFASHLMASSVNSYDFALVHGYSLLKAQNKTAAELGKNFFFLHF